MNTRVMVYALALLQLLSSEYASVATGIEDPAEARFLAKQRTWLGYQDNRAPAKVDVAVQDRLKADRLAWILELQEKFVKETVCA